MLNIDLESHCIRTTAQDISHTLYLLLPFLHLARIREELVDTK